MRAPEALEPLAQFLARVRNMVRVPQRERTPDIRVRPPRKTANRICLWCHDPLPTDAPRNLQYCGPRCRVSSLRDKNAAYHEQRRFTVIRGGRAT